MGEWDLRFLRLAREISLWSKDPSTQVGAALIEGKNRILSTGYNGFPVPIPDHPEDLEDRRIKYTKMIHAEENALLFRAARIDLLLPLTLYTWPIPPCSHCAILGLQCGVTRFISVIPDEERLRRWGHNLELAQTIIREAGMEIELLHPEDLGE